MARNLIQGRERVCKNMVEKHQVGTENYQQGGISSFAFWLNLKSLYIF